MRNQSVLFNFDLFCEWTKEPPLYRVYINHELFTERTYIWGDTQYIQEVINLKAPAGTYNIRVDNLGDADCVFKIRNLTISEGNAQVVNHKTIEILNEST